MTGSIDFKNKKTLSKTSEICRCKTNITVEMSGKEFAEQYRTSAQEETRFNITKA